MFSNHPKMAEKRKADYFPSFSPLFSMGRKWVCERYSPGDGLLLNVGICRTNGFCQFCTNPLEQWQKPDSFLGEILRVVRKGSLQQSIIKK